MVGKNPGRPVRAVSVKFEKAELDFIEEWRRRRHLRNTSDAVRGILWDAYDREHGGVA